VCWCADGVELDVRLTPDGELIVRHDPFPLDLAQLDPAEMARLNTAPDLTTVLDACGERMLVNVEIKNLASDGGFDPTMTIVRLTIDELRRRGPDALDRWLISSFSWATIEACRAMAPDIATAFLCVSLDEPTVERIVAAGHRAAHPWERIVTASMVERCHAAGLTLNTWTCNTPERLVELERIGVDGVCTDVPARALAALGRPAFSPSQRGRGSWGTPA
jgi:glycerophosphoryl diester phosphodiesterase